LILHGIYLSLGMIIRDTKIPILLKEFPAVAIIGPRQVGKSTLAKQIATATKKPFVFLDMELQSDRRKLSDPEAFFEANRNVMIIIDEIQQMPTLFSALRPEIDAKRKPGRFILTGSADPALIKGISESLAGRIAYASLAPFSLVELSTTKYSVSQHWFRGGYPNALLAKTDDAFHRWMENYIQTFVQRDLQILFDIQLSSTITRNLWTMLANNNSGLLNTETYARALGITGPTVKRYIQFLEGAFLIRLLQPWFANSTKRLVKSPKVYIRDTGILHHLTHINTAKHLMGTIVVGHSWEGYVIEEIIKQLPSHLLPYFYRTSHGAELDLVLVKNGKPFVGIEVKHSKAPVASDGFYNSIADLNTAHNFIIYTGHDVYPIKQKVIVCGLSSFLTRLKKLK
jgi:hypothetical protein